MSDNDSRNALRRLVKERGESYAALSRMIGRNAAYLQQFVTRGSPARLEERDRKLLASYLQVDEVALGGMPSEHPIMHDLVSVRRLNIEAAAGAGLMIDGEYAVGRFRFERSWLNQISHAGPDELSIITFVGDSMAPTINDGDDGLVDHSNLGRRVRDGIYVLRRDEALMVKRLAVTPRAGTITIVSDNPAYPTWQDVSLSEVDVLGRVVWIGRKLI
ncbi:S24 family peptidase [Sphingomonas crusticola]|uniref:S24 family peptidase n=1 Tax=Sphingomonas crusticola TaxID=1697973 RepID=UPI0013C2FD62|nr:helix-turn-helix transcriptional regulator [Sphingomonas crusticola]